MRLAEITDEFSKINQQQTLDHLFRVQKQRCTELTLFVDYLKTKYPSLSLSLSSSSLPSSLLSLSWTSSLWTKWLRENNVSQQDIDKYQSKYNRMIEAKKAYEKAGGTYKETSKLDEVIGGVDRIYTTQDLSFFGFHLDQTEEREDDNIKLWHTMILPNGNRETLDHSPYELIDQDAFKRYVLFYKKHKRFPTRQDIHSVGPLNNEDLIQLK